MSKTPSTLNDISLSEWQASMTETEQDFVNAYLIMQSVTGACDMIGLPRTRGARLLNAPKIKTAIAIGKREIRAGSDITTGDIVEDLRLIRDMALGRIPVPITTITKDGDPVTHFVRQTNLAQASKSVENLGRMIGAFTDRKEITVPASDDQIIKKIEEILGVTIEGSSEEVIDANQALIYKSEQVQYDELRTTTVEAIQDELLTDPVLSAGLEEKLDRKRTKEKQ